MVDRPLVRCAVVALAVLALTSCYGNTESAENVTTTSATLMAWGVPQKGTSTDFYYEYGTTDPPTTPTPVQHADGLTIGQVYPIPVNVNGLAPDTRYYFRLCGKEREETAYACGTVSSFVTKTFSMANPLFITPFNWYAHADIKLVDVDGVLYGTGTGCGFTRSLASAFGTAYERVNTVLCSSEPGHRPALMDPSLGMTFWATEASRVGNQWIAVTTGARRYPERGADYWRGAIWVATAPGPEGPWTWKDEAIATDIDDSYLDGSLFADPLTGKTWLTWTSQNNWGSGGTGTNELLAQELDPADRTRVKPGSQPVVLLSTDVEPQDRERAYGRRIVEGQGVFAFAGRYFLYYAAGNYGFNTGTETYTFNIADSRETFPGRFTKRANPDLSGTSAWKNPGHGSVFIDAGANPWLAVSAWKQIDTTVNRYPVLQKMTFDHATKTFKIYDGAVNTGQIGVPVP